MLFHQKAIRVLFLLGSIGLVSACNSTSGSGTNGDISDDEICSLICPGEGEAMTSVMTFFFGDPASVREGFKTARVEISDFERSLQGSVLLNGEELPEIVIEDDKADITLKLIAGENRIDGRLAQGSETVYETSTSIVASSAIYQLTLSDSHIRAGEYFDIQFDVAFNESENAQYVYYYIGGADDTPSEEEFIAQSADSGSVVVADQRILSIGQKSIQFYYVEIKEGQTYTGERQSIDFTVHPSTEIDPCLSPTPLHGEISEIPVMVEAIPLPYESCEPSVYPSDDIQPDLP